MRFANQEEVNWGCYLEGSTNKKFLEVQEPFFQKGSWPPEALLFPLIRKQAFKNSICLPG
jgi:hypothetical protein